MVTDVMMEPWVIELMATDAVGVTRSKAVVRSASKPVSFAT